MIADGISHFSFLFFYKIHLTCLFPALLLQYIKYLDVNYSRKWKEKTKSNNIMEEEWRNSRIESKTCATINLIQKGNCFFCVCVCFFSRENDDSTKNCLHWNKNELLWSNWKWYACENNCLQRLKRSVYFGLCTRHSLIRSLASLRKTINNKTKWMKNPKKKDRKANETPSHKIHYSV